MLVEQIVSPADSGTSTTSRIFMTSFARSGPTSIARPCTFMSLPPEIHCMILSTLSSHDLTHCARVSKTFHAMSTPLIWRTVEVQTRKALMGFMRAEVRQAATRNARFAHTLNVAHKNLFNILISPQYLSCASQGFAPIKNQSNNSTTHLYVNLRTLIIDCLDLCTNESNLHFESPLAALTSNMFHATLAMVQNSPQLTSIMVFNEMPAAIARKLVLICPRSVRDLYLSPAPCLETTKYLLDNLPEQITTLKLYGIGLCMDDFPVVWPDDEPHSDIKPHHTLQTLELFGMLDGFEEFVLLPFLETCTTNLTNFHSTDLACFHNGKVSKALGDLGIVLDRLEPCHFPRGENSDDTEIASVISFSKRLQDLNISGCHRAGPATLAAVREHCETIQILRLSGRFCIASRGILPILCEAKHLKHFQAIDHTPWTIPYPFLSVETLDTKWASSSLEVFCSHVQVPRTNDHVPTEHQVFTRGLPSLQECRHIERCFHRQLAKQTKLKELCFGLHDIGSVQPFTHWYSLEMTLHSGLDELADLKGLKVLRVIRTNHRIGTSELAWMAANWPRLERIEGLYSGDGQSILEMKDWLKTNRPHWICS